jgi:hypothetical protein
MTFLIMRLTTINSVKINYLSEYLVSDEILIEIFQANGFEDNIVLLPEAKKPILFWQLGLGRKTYRVMIKAKVTD